MLTVKSFISWFFEGKTVQSTATRNIGKIKQILQMPNDQLQIGVYWQNKPGYSDQYWNAIDTLVLINESDPEFI